MKVLQINATFGIGSTGLIVKDIGEMAEKEGHTAYFAYQKAKVHPKNGYLVGNKKAWKWHALYARLFGKQAYASKRSTKKLLKWIDSIQPDIVHLHNLHSNYINLNMLCDYLAKKDILTVITLHDCWYFTGKCSHYVAVDCDRWKTSCGNCPRLKDEQPSLFFDNTRNVLKDKIEHLNKISNLIVVGCSRWVVEEVKKSHLTPKRVETIYNGVDTEIFTPHESNFRKTHAIENQFLIMGMADKWGDEKNKEIVEKIITNNADAKILIVGHNGSKKEWLQSFDNVLVLGYISDRKELADIYAAADVFVNLTHADTLPTVNMESICCGTPVITFDCCGSPELVDEDSGYIIKENDAEDLLKKLDLLKKQALQFNVLEKQKKFDKKTCYQKYLDVYKN